MPCTSPRHWGSRPIVQKQNLPPEVPPQGASEAGSSGLTSCEIANVHRPEPLHESHVAMTTSLLAR